MNYDNMTEEERQRLIFEGIAPNPSGDFQTVANRLNILPEGGIPTQEEADLAVALARGQDMAALEQEAIIPLESTLPEQAPMGLLDSPELITPQANLPTREELDLILGRTQAPADYGPVPEMDLTALSEAPLEDPSSPHPVDPALTEPANFEALLKAARQEADKRAAGNMMFSGALRAATGLVGATPTEQIHQNLVADAETPYSTTLDALKLQQSAATRRAGRPYTRTGQYLDEAGNRVVGMFTYIPQPDGTMQVMHGERDISNKEIAPYYAPQTRTDPLTRDILRVDQSAPLLGHEPLSSPRRPVSTPDVRPELDAFNRLGIEPVAPTTQTVPEQPTTRAPALELPTPTPTLQPSDRDPIRDQVIQEARAQEQGALKPVPSPTEPLADFSPDFHPTIVDYENEIRKLEQKQRNLRPARRPDGTLDIRKYEEEVKKVERQINDIYRDQNEAEKQIRENMQRARLAQTTALNLYQNMADIRGLKDEVNTGFIIQPLRYLGEFFDFPGPMSNELKARIAGAMAVYIKDRSGTAASEKEVQRLRDVMPQMTDDDNQFLDKLRAFTQMAEFDRRAALIGTGLFQPDEQMQQDLQTVETQLDRIRQGSGRRKDLKESPQRAEIESRRKELESRREAIQKRREELQRKLGQ